MATITPERISDLIATAPAWAKVSLTMPNEQLRQDGTATIAQHIYGALFQPMHTDVDQLTLPL
jgi:hypothetical protein